MDTGTLVNQRFVKGYDLVKSLSGTLDISCACWLLADESHWFLFIVCEDVDRKGGLATYREVYDKLERMQAVQFGMSDIKILGKKNRIARDLLRLFEELQPTEPIFVEDDRLEVVGARAGYFYPRAEETSEWLANIKREYPSAEPFVIDVSLMGPITFSNLLSTISPYMGKVNASEFEGRQAETVLCMGPRVSRNNPIGQIGFVYRPEGWNKLFRPELNLWDEVVHSDTGKKLYESVDFGPLSAMRMHPHKKLDVPF